jgi:hypothetical protein
LGAWLVDVEGWFGVLLIWGLGVVGIVWIIWEIRRELSDRDHDREDR